MHNDRGIPTKICLKEKCSLQKSFINHFCVKPMKNFTILFLSLLEILFQSIYDHLFLHEYKNLITRGENAEV